MSETSLALPISSHFSDIADTFFRGTILGANETVLTSHVSVPVTFYTEEYYFQLLPLKRSYLPRRQLLRTLDIIKYKQMHLSYIFNNFHMNLIDPMSYQMHKLYFHPELTTLLSIVEARFPRNIPSNWLHLIRKIYRFLRQKFMSEYTDCDKVLC